MRGRIRTVGVSSFAGMGCGLLPGGLIGGREGRRLAFPVGAGRAAGQGRGQRAELA